ncbi:MAG TPA: hypothetical protein VFJ76_03415 [Solirubrobacterales bacterium]|nr:hypothetical protein [Solirubrobacterales bacterium]
MFSRLHGKLGTAGLVVGVVALVVALGGAAFAASGLSGPEKKEIQKQAKKFSKKFSKQFATPGPAGPQGPKGDTGAAGAAGKDGTNGTDGSDGTNGTNGESVTLGTAGGECPAGGVTVQVGTKTATKKAVCNGEDGETGFTETLPTGATETGNWSIQEGGLMSLSFNIPLPAAPEVHVLKEGEGETTDCPGNVEEPEAAAGQLCLYTLLEAELAWEPEWQVFFPGSLNAYGATLQFATGTGMGTWAVTAS